MFGQTTKKSFFKTAIVFSDTIFLFPIKWAEIWNLNIFSKTT
jgi:hypothetical protein